MEKKVKEIKKREKHIIRVGPKFYKLLLEQRNNIKKASYDCITPSDYDVSEIIAEKVEQFGGIKFVERNII